MLSVYVMCIRYLYTHPCARAYATARRHRLTVLAVEASSCIARKLTVLKLGVVPLQRLSLININSTYSIFCIHGHWEIYHFDVIFRRKGNIWMFSAYLLNVKKYFCILNRLKIHYSQMSFRLLCRDAFYYLQFYLFISHSYKIVKIDSNIGGN